MTFTPKLLEQYRECEKALLEAERLLQDESSSAARLSALEKILASGNDAMKMLRNHREYGPKVEPILAEISRINQEIERKKREDAIGVMLNNGGISVGSYLEEEERLRKQSLEFAIDTEGVANKYSNLRIESLESQYAYVISNLPIAGKIYDVWLLHWPLDCGNEYTQQDWLEMENKLGWHLPDVKMFHAIMRGAYYGAKSSSQEIRDCSLSLKDMLMNNFMTGPLMTSTSIGKAISVKASNLDSSGKRIYQSDEEVAIDSERTGLLLNGNDFYNGIETLLQGDFKEAKAIYKWAAGTCGLELPVEIGLTLPEDYGVVTLEYQRASDEGGPYILFNVNGANPKNKKARARGIRIFNR